jgi:hypothetical protein
MIFLMSVGALGSSADLSQEMGLTAWLIKVIRQIGYELLVQDGLVEKTTALLLIVSHP